MYIKITNHQFITWLPLYWYQKLARWSQKYYEYKKKYSGQLSRTKKSAISKFNKVSNSRKLIKRSAKESVKFAAKYINTKKALHKLIKTIYLKSEWEVAEIITGLFQN